MPNNLLIIGAPKCGTDSLRDMLNEISSISIDSPNEDHRFLSEDVEAEIDLFAAAKLVKPNAELFGVKGTWYLYNLSALRRLNLKYPQARVVICVRPAIELLVSWHQQLFRTGVQKIEDLNEAWDCSLSGSDHSVLNDQSWMLNYPNIVNIGPKISSALSIFRDPAPFIVTLKSIKENDLAELGLYLGYEEFNFRLKPKFANRAYTVKSSSLENALTPPEFLLDRLKRLGIQGTGLGGRLRAVRDFINHKPTGAVERISTIREDIRLECSLYDEMLEEYLGVKKLKQQNYYS